MNLNQAAHGDREFGYIQTRMGVARKIVAGHASDPVVAERVGAWARAAARLAEPPLVAAGPVRRQHARRRGDRGRQGRGARCGSASRSTPTASTTSSRSSTQVADSDIDTLVAEYDDSYEVAPELRPGGDRRDSLRYAARIRAGPALLPRRRRLHRVHHQLPGPRRAAAAARPRGAAADGRRLRLRRRGRLEDLGAAARAQGDVRRPRRRHVVHGGLHLPPRPRRPEDPRRAHARGVPDASPPSDPSVEIHPLGIGDREDPVRLVFTAAPGPGFVVGISRPRGPVPADRQRDRGRRARRAAAQASRRPRRLEARTRPERPRPRAGCSPAARTTPS